MANESLRVAMLGAGGVGGVYGGELSRAGHAVAFLARGGNLDAIRSRGLEVRTPEGAFTAAVDAADDPASLGARDLAILAVKTYSLESILPAARLLAGRGATILPLLNGVDAAERLVAGGVPKESILGGLTSVSAARVAPGVVERRSTFQRVTVGELGGGASDRARRVAAALGSAGIETSVSEDIVLDLWRKLAFISSMAAACGLSRSPVSAMREAPYGMLLFERAVNEVFAVAKARGIRVAEDDAAKTLRFIESLSPALKPSLLLDLEAGGPTEVGDLSGAVARFGREAGVATPVHDTATAALSAASARTA